MACGVNMRQSTGTIQTTITFGTPENILMIGMAMVFGTCGTQMGTEYQMKNRLKTWMEIDHIHTALTHLPVAQTTMMAPQTMSFGAAIVSITIMEIQSE